MTVPGNRVKYLEGHDLAIEVGSTDSDDTTVLHIPDLELVVAGDARSTTAFQTTWPKAWSPSGRPTATRSSVQALKPRHITRDDDNNKFDDDAELIPGRDRQYTLMMLTKSCSRRRSPLRLQRQNTERYPDHLGDCPGGGAQAPSTARRTTPSTTARR